MFYYTVRCRFAASTNESVIESWLEWLRQGHIQDVIDGGATGASIVEMETEEPESVYEIRYQFPERATFANYETETAPGLREEGLQKFPLELGLSYERTIGQELDTFGR